MIYIVILLFLFIVILLLLLLKALADPSWVAHGEEPAVFGQRPAAFAGAEAIGGHRHSWGKKGK